MDKNTEARLTLEGWTVACEHPLELEHEDGSFASGQAADLVIEQMSAFSKVSKLTQFQKLKLLQSEAEQINDLVQLWVQRCIVGRKNLDKDDDSLWKVAYGLIFSDNINARIRSIAQLMSIAFEWNDPDAGYEDDVLAYAHGLQDFVNKTAIFLIENQD